MTPQSQCSLCDHPADITRESGADLSVQVHCSTCGWYQFHRTLLDDGVLKRRVGGEDKRYILSALTRRRSDSGRPLTIAGSQIAELIASAPGLTPLSLMDKVLLYVADRQTRADVWVKPDLAKDYPLVWARDAEEFAYLLSMLGTRGLLEGTRDILGEIVVGPSRLTPDGWAKADELRRLQPRSDQAFVAMHFTEELKSAWEHGFKPALEANGYKPYRVDLDEHNEDINDRIVASIRRSGLLVADFTGNRPGVYYEAGFARGLGIPVVYTCRESYLKELHFDINHINHVVWTDPAGLKDKLDNRIAATVPRPRSA